MEGNSSNRRNTRTILVLCPCLSTTPTIMAQSTGINETEFQVIVRLVASASTEMVYLLIPVAAVSALSPELPPPSTSCSMLGGPGRFKTLGKLPL